MREHALRDFLPLKRERESRAQRLRPRASERDNDFVRELVAISCRREKSGEESCGSLYIHYLPLTIFMLRGADGSVYYLKFKTNIYNRSMAYSFVEVYYIFEHKTYISLSSNCKLLTQIPERLYSRALQNALCEKKNLSRAKCSSV